MFRKIKLLCIFLLILTSLNSCILGTLVIGTALVAGGAVYYMNGYYIIEIPKSMRTVFNATIKTIQTNNVYSLETQSYTDKTAYVVTGLGSDKVYITLTNIDNKITEIKIRVGILGDENTSANLANQITKYIT